MLEINIKDTTDLYIYIYTQICGRFSGSEKPDRFQETGKISSHSVKPEQISNTLFSSLLTFIPFTFKLNTRDRYLVISQGHVFRNI